MRKIELINTEGGAARAVLAGYYKFYGATIVRDFNGATAVIEYETYQTEEPEGSERNGADSRG